MSNQAAEAEQLQARLNEVFEYFKKQVELMEQAGILREIDTGTMGPLLQMAGIDLSWKGIFAMAQAKLSMAGKHPEATKMVMTMLYDALGYCLGYTDQIGG